MGSTTPESEPQDGTPDSFVEPIPQLPNSTETAKNSGERLPDKLVETLIDIRTAMERHSVLETDAQAAEAYQAAQTLLEKLMNAVETAQGLPAQSRRGLLYTFSTLTLLGNSLQNLVAINQKFKDSSEIGELLKKAFADRFKADAKEYRQWLLQAVGIKET